MFWIIVVVVLTIGFSFFCSIWEAALYSIPPSRVEYLRQQGTSQGRRLWDLRNNIDRPISAILTLNTIAHTAGATVAGSLVEIYWKGHLTIFSIFFVIAILVLSEIIPKTLGYFHANRLAPLSAWPIQTLVWILYPAVILSQWITRFFQSKNKEKYPTEEDILSVARLGVKEGEILPEEGRWLKNVLALNDVKVEEIMRPALEIGYQDPDTTLADLWKKASSLPYSRMPLFEKGDINRPVGKILRKEVLAALSQDRMELKLSDLARPLGTVGPQTPAHHILRRMIKEREHLVLVVDENGKTLGIMTLEDIIETMLGIDIRDEAEITGRR